ncbi:MAG: phosphoribosylamine--glycine ligase [Arcanobacterium sp.]|nr:phosphoribosylamine--glycine ligase [Arcanobacterium sp.]
MKVLVVGGGGREMALVQHLIRFGHEVICAGGSAAIQEIATVIELQDFTKLAEYAQSAGIDLTIVGPEAPLAAGIVDVFQAAKQPIFGPNLAAAQIEASKAFAKEVMTTAGVPTAQYQRFNDPDAVRDFLAGCRYPQVLKEDGLRAGKGVTICQSEAEAHAVINNIPLDSENPLIIEDFLDGFEFSLIVMAHGTNFVALPVAQDHKPIGEGNTGANTGGMGAVSPVPKVTEEIYAQAIAQVIRPTLAEMERRGTPFTGFLYAGLIQTTDGVFVIEFNARLGDPECEVILPRLDGDIAATAVALLAGKTPELPVANDFCVGVVLSSPGYPGKITASPEIPGALFAAVQEHPQAEIVHMGTRYDEASNTWFAAGGRVAIVTLRGAELPAVRAELNELLEQALVDSELYWRRDIGSFAG